MTDQHTAAPDSEAKPASFEAAMEELGRIVEGLENASISLENSIKAYERGMFLKQFCQDKLKSAKLRITQVDEAQHTASTKETPQ